MAAQLELRLPRAPVGNGSSDVPSVVSMFAGIGGFDLGFERMGYSTSYFCELDEFCSSVLRRHWPSVDHGRDIRDVEAATLANADVWCGGFPCQDVSVARGWLGRDGLKGKNTGLFYPFMDLVKSCRPQVVLLENVTGLLSSHSGEDFGVILRMLCGEGYGVAWRVLNTRFFGAPQSRPRVYICAWHGNASSAIRALYESIPGHSTAGLREGFMKGRRCKRTGAHVPDVAYCLAATSGRHTGTDWSRSYVSYSEHVRRLTPTECERLQGFPVGWTLPGTDFPLPDDELDTLRYHALGNAVSVPVIEWIAKRIRDQLRECANGGPPPDPVAQSPDLSADALQEIDLEGDLAGTKWRSGGYAYGKLCFDAKVPPGQGKPQITRFMDIVEKRRVAERYFLSPNAATGILRRVSSQGRQLFPPLEEALSALASKNGQ